MGRQDPSIAVLQPSDYDIWDRVGALAPADKPVAGRLFTKTSRDRKRPVVPSLDVPLTTEALDRRPSDRKPAVQDEPELEERAQTPRSKRRRTPRPKPLLERGLPEFAPEVDPSDPFTAGLDRGAASGSEPGFQNEIAANLIPKRAEDKALRTPPEFDLTVSRGAAPGLALGRDYSGRLDRAWARLRPAVLDAPDMYHPLQASVARVTDSVVSQSFDLLRMRLLQTMKENGWRRVAITSPTPGCGSTFVACNLAVSLARIREQRTLLMDFNLRAPGVAKAFALRTETDMVGLLAGEVSVRDAIQRYGENVAFGAGRTHAKATAEMLYDTRTIAALDRLDKSLSPDVMLFDLPPMLAYDDVSAFLPQVDGVLLVSNGTKTMGKEIAACERAIGGRTKLLGVVLNETRKSDSKAAGYRNV